MDYYDNNVGGALALIQAMHGCKIDRLVFASSATVYGAPVHLPIDEDHPSSPCNPYGRSKLLIETMLEDLLDTGFRSAILRFFNPAGAHESGLIGDNPVGRADNLMPYLSQVAAGRRPYLDIFGNDYDTRDGTGVRDYVHVMDIATGHLQALRSLETRSFVKVDLGTGTGKSVWNWYAPLCTSGKRDRLPVRAETRRRCRQFLCQSPACHGNSRMERGAFAARHLPR